MIKIKITDDNKVTIEPANKDNAACWMENNNIGAYFGHRYRVIFLDGNNKLYHLKRKVNKEVRAIDAEIKALEERKATLLGLLSEDLDIDIEKDMDIDQEKE